MEGLSCLCVVKTLTMLCLMKFAITFLLNTQYIIIKTLSQNQSGAERVVLSRESVCVCVWLQLYKTHSYSICIIGRE